MYDVVSKKKKWVRLLNWKRRAFIFFLNSENEELIIRFNVEINVMT
jgi:hypothetical protein